MSDSRRLLQVRDTIAELRATLALLEKPDRVTVLDYLLAAAEMEAGNLLPDSHQKRTTARESGG